MVVKALLQNERLRVGGSLNFDFRSSFEKGSIEFKNQKVDGLWEDAGSSHERRFYTVPPAVSVTPIEVRRLFKMSARI